MRCTYDISQQNSEIRSLKVEVRFKVAQGETQGSVSDSVGRVTINWRCRGEKSRSDL